jgi:uncharacterized ion transporter superfamily protein YfcC
MLGGIALAALLTWTLPAGEFARRDDPSTGRRVAVAGSYHRVDSQPVGPFGALVAIPRGFVEGSDVIGVVLFVGGAWVLLERLGTMGVVVGALVGAFRRRRALAIPAISLFFATMGALENMEEELIPLTPVLLALGAGLGIDPVAVVAMSAGAAMVGAAFGPTNPFQAGIALKLAQLPPLSAGGLRLTLFVAGVAAWTAFTVRHSSRARSSLGEAPPSDLGASSSTDHARRSGKHALALAALVLPMALYVYGSLAFGWGFNELSAVFFAGAIAAGLIGGLGLTGTLTAYVDGMRTLLPPAFMIGLARSISLVLTDGRVVDSILNALVGQLARLPAAVTAFLMVPFHAALHVAVPSVSGQAVLTMPILVPLSDLLGLSRQVPVLAYQIGAGLMELFTPTNGAIMGVLLAAGVPYERWVRFAMGAVLIPLLVGLLGLAVATWTSP